MNTQKHYNLTIDILRILSVVCVILIHTSTKSLQIIGHDIQAAPFTLFINQFVRFSVPLFFFISGFVLELNYGNHTNAVTFYRKRLNRLLVPYIFWSFLYFVGFQLSHVWSIGERNFIGALITGTSAYHLYFIPSLVLFYAFFPLLHRYYTIITKGVVLVVIFMVEMILLHYDYYIHLLHIDSFLRVAIFNVFIFLFGMYAAHHDERIVAFTKKWKNPLIILFIIVSAVVFAEAWHFYLKTENYLFIYNQWRPSMLIHCVLIIALLYTALQKTQRYMHIVKKLSALSLFVYFIHVVVLEHVWKILLNPMINTWGEKIVSQVWFDVLFLVLVTGISLGVAFLAHKIPKLNLLTG